MRVCVFLFVLKVCVYINSKSSFRSDRIFMILCFVYMVVLMMPTRYILFLVLLWRPTSGESAIWKAEMRHKSFVSAEILR